MRPAKTLSIIEGEGMKPPPSTMLCLELRGFSGRASVSCDKGGPKWDPEPRRGRRGVVIVVVEAFQPL
jgi:hypothetical protein